MQEIIRLKLADALELPFPELTVREARLSMIPRKAHAVIGMRRAGKTYFLYQCLQERLQQKIPRDRLVYFNFEDDRLAGLTAENLSFIIEEYYRQFPDYRRQTTVTFCFDEIQTVPGWERFVRRLLDEEDVEILLSGSSAKLLSREIATGMRGRAVETVISPFCFREFLRHRNIPVPKYGALLSSATRSHLLRAFDQYLLIGGFPEAQDIAEHERVQLLQGYVNVVLFRDIVERHQVTNVTALRALVRQLLRNAGTSMSISKIYNNLHSQGIRVSKESLLEFVDHLQDSFLIDLVEIYSQSERRKQVNPRKIYVADHALANAFYPAPAMNRGHLLENIVARELLHRSRAVHYYKTQSGYEVDFLAHTYAGEEHLIQVALSVTEADTLERECRALIEAGQEHPHAAASILTENEERTIELPQGRTIHLLPVWRWLCQPFGQEH